MTIKKTGRKPNSKPSVSKHITFSADTFAKIISAKRRNQTISQYLNELIRNLQDQNNEQQ